MLNSLIRTAACFATSTVALAASASCASAHDPSSEVRGDEKSGTVAPHLVAQRVNYGQSVHAFPAYPASADRMDAPYALTGTDRADRRNVSNRWIDAGQGRVFIPAATNR